MEYEIEQFFEMSVDLLCIAGTDGFFKRVNCAFERTLGWTRDELLRLPFLDFVHPDDRQATLGELSRLASGIPSRSFENRYRAVDGGYKRLLWTAVPKDGSTLIYAVGHDVTEKSRRAARAMQLANAVEQTADAVIITDRNGVIEYVNPAFEHTTGYTAEEALGRTPRLLKSGHHSSDFYRQIWTSLFLGEVVRGVLINRKKDGREYSAEQTITPMRDPQGTITNFVSVVKDITELRKREDQDLELRLAASIQRRLYPAAPPIIEGLDLAGKTMPSGAMNGDYFDFVTLGDGSLGIAIGDVCGHGLGQALVMGEARAYLRSIARVQTDVGQILTDLDRMLAPDLELGSFMSMLLVRVDVRTGLLWYANAGHEVGAVLDASGAIKLVLDSTGLPLGLPEEVNRTRVVASSEPLVLAPGDVIALLTDGVAEAESAEGAPFGVRATLDFIGAHSEAAPRAIVDGLLSTVASYRSESTQPDDVTVVVGKYLS